MEEKIVKEFMSFGKAGRVLLYLYEQSGAKGYCMQSYKEIAEACGIKSVQTVVRHLGMLEECCAIEIEKMYDNHGTRLANLYKCNVGVPVER